MWAPGDTCHAAEHGSAGMSQHGLPWHPRSWTAHSTWCWGQRGKTPRLRGDVVGFSVVGNVVDGHLCADCRQTETHTPFLVPQGAPTFRGDFRPLLKPPPSEGPFPLICWRLLYKFRASQRGEAALIAIICDFKLFLSWERKALTKKLLHIYFNIS